MNNNGTFLPPFWISKVKCPFSVIFLPLYALRMVFDFTIFGVFFQSFNLVFWNYISLSPRIKFVADVGHVRIEC